MLRCHACDGDDLALEHLQPGLRIASAEVDTRFDVATRVCRRCGLVQTLPQPPAELLARFYASQHRDLFVETDAARVPGAGSRRDQRRWMESAIGNLFGLRVLEVGCYDGHLLALLEERGALGVGVEPSRGASELARARYGLDVRSGLLEEVDLPAGGFDLVVMSHVLEHVTDPRATLDRCRKAVRENGWLFVEVPNVLRPRVESAVDFFTFDHLFHFSPATLDALAARSGFVRERCDEDFPFPALRWLGRAGSPAMRELADPRAVADGTQAVRAYVEARRDFVDRLRARVARDLDRWRSTGARIAVYGAGFHTEALFATTELRRAEIVAVVDGNPAKHGTRFAELPVVAPESLASLDVDVVVISSFDFQHEMLETVRRVRAARPPEIVTFYESPKAFSNFAGRPDEDHP